MIYFGSKLKQLREDNGLTQDQLAEVLEVKGGTVSQYELSKTYPSVEKLIRIAHYFKVSTDYLLGLTETNQYDQSGLTDDQAVVVTELIREFERANAKAKE